MCHSCLLKCVDSDSLCSSWAALSRFGRRTIYLTGILSIGLCLLPIGILGTTKQSDPALNAMGGLMIAINLLFHFSLGPVCELHAAPSTTVGPEAE